MRRRGRVRALLVMAAMVAAAPGLGACARRPAKRVARPHAPAAELRAAVDRAVAATVDVITYSVEVERKASVVVDLAEPGARIAGLRIIDAGRDPDQPLDGRVRERRWYK